MQILHPGTLILTDYGIIRIDGILVNMKVPSKSGEVYVTKIGRNRNDPIKFRFETDVGTVICDARTMFLKDDHRVAITRLMPGDKIDTLYGQAEILKRTYVFTNNSFYTIKTNSYNSSFAIYNGILVIN